MTPARRVQRLEYRAAALCILIGGTAGPIGATLVLWEFLRLPNWQLFVGFLATIGVAYGLGPICFRRQRLRRVGYLSLLVVNGVLGWLAGTVLAGDLLSVFGMSWPVGIAVLVMSTLCGAGLAAWTFVQLDQAASS